jgi:hypothetical protein
MFSDTVSGMESSVMFSDTVSGMESSVMFSDTVSGMESSVMFSDTVDSGDFNWLVSFCESTGIGSSVLSSLGVWPIITLNEASAVFPDLSVAVHFTWLRPNGKVLPEGGSHVVTVLPSTVSEAFASYVILAPWRSSACLRILCGTLKVGGEVSFTVTLNMA